MDLQGKVVLITGGASGIGAAAAAHFAELGAKVAIVDINEQGLAEVAEQIKNAGSSAPLQIIADLTKDVARTIVDETINHFGQLYVLINNAGIAVPSAFCDMKMEDFDRVFDVNVRSVIKLTQLCVPHLEKTKGNIVNVSSISGLRPIVTQIGYGISKAALDSFSKYCALELAPKGIRSNSINPAGIKTPIFKKFGMSDEMIESLYEQIESTFPVGRVGEVTDTNAAIEFLADNEKSSFLTGVLLSIDGGCMLTDFCKPKFK